MRKGIEHDYQRWHGPTPEATTTTKPISPVDELVRLMQEIVQQGDDKRTFVACLARHAVIHIYAQRGENQMRRTANYCEKIGDEQTIRLAGNVFRRFSAKTNTIIGDVTNMAVSGLSAELSSMK